MDNGLKIVVLADYFFPSVRAGGPLKSIKAQIPILKEFGETIVITRNRDLGIQVRYEFIDKNPYAMQIMDVRVIYCGNMATVLQQLLKISPHIIWANSMFSRYTFCGLLYSFLRRGNIIISPRGELRSTALKRKALVKRAYLEFLAKMNLRFFVNSLAEEKLVQRYFSKSKVLTAPQLVDEPEDIASLNSVTERSGLVFVGRLVEVKNLDFILDIYETGCIDRDLDIYGDFENEQYRTKISERIKRYNCTEMGKGRIELCGIYAPGDAVKILSGYKALLMPSKGENFGHVIYEALAANLYVIVSPHTYWSGELLQGAGKVLSLDKREWIDSIKNIPDYGRNPLRQASIYYRRAKLENKNQIHELFRIR